MKTDLEIAMDVLEQGSTKREAVVLPRHSCGALLYEFDRLRSIAAEYEQFKKDLLGKNQTGKES